MPAFAPLTRVSAFWDRLRGSFWFLPSLMAAGAALLSAVAVEGDRRLGAEGTRALGWVYTFGPEGARAVLSAVASSMITVAGLTFSMTMLTLQLASSQFGPRLLPSFMRDRGNQIVLGTFIATFLYCLLVLRTVRGVEGAAFVPHLAVFGGVALAVASLGVLIFFIHHVAVSIRVETLLENLAREGCEATDRLCPEPGDIPAPAQAVDAARTALRGPARAIHATESGYVQRLDADALLDVASARDLLVGVEAPPGRFVKAGDVLLLATPAERVSSDVENRLRDGLVLGAERTPRQDLAFSLRRIVEIAQRALSPGINDPTTALYCVDRLEEVLCRLASRAAPSPLRTDASGRARVLVPAVAVEDVAVPALAAVARYGAGDADVAARLLDAIDAVRRAAREPGARPGLVALRADLVARARAKAELAADADRLAARTDAG